MVWQINSLNNNHVGPENCLENFLSFFNWFSLSISIAIFFSSNFLSPQIFDLSLTLHLEQAIYREKRQYQVELCSNTACLQISSSCPLLFPSFKSQCWEVPPFWSRTFLLLCIRSIFSYLIFKFSSLPIFSRPYLQAPSPQNFFLSAFRWLSLWFH